MNDTRLNIGLQTKLTQKLLITPQMKQSLSLLQMPITELAQEISEYLEANPALEVDEPWSDDDDFPPAQETEGEADAEPIEDSLLENLNTPEWDEYINEGNSNELSYTPMSDEDIFDYEQFLSSTTSLSEHLLFQLKTAGVSEEVVTAGEEIIGNLTDDGYFLMDLKELAALAGVSHDAGKKALMLIKTFDPAGIASQSFSECIIAQLPGVGASEGEIEQIKELLTNYSEEIIAYKYDEICKKSGLDRENIEDLMNFIRHTDPRPGLNFAESGNNYILPDVYIIRNGAGYDVLLNETGMPAIKLNNQYLRALRDTKLDDETRAYIEDKVKNAVWILKSLQKRQKAIYKVSKAIVDIQAEYLSMGEAHLKPLRLKDIAEITELHESTVSRVTAGKYASTDQGLLELKSFFSKGMDSDDGDVSTRSIKVMIKEIVDSEPAGKPYSDEAIVKVLSGQGVEIARRTIAKYRDEMNIPTMSQRKRMRR